MTSRGTRLPALRAGAVLLLLLLLLLHNTRTEGATTEATATSTDDPTVTSTDATTVTSTDAPTATSTDAPTATSTDAPTATSTDAPTATSTDAPTATSTDAPTATSTDAPTATSTDAPTATSTDAPTATSTDATTVTSTDAPTATSTDAPTATSTDAPTATSTDAPTATSTDAPTATSTDAPTATSTDAPTATSTDAPTATSTDAPTATSTDAPTATSTDAPTATSTDAPTATSTDTPTATSTDAPTATSTDAPTATSTDAPTATSTDATTVTSTDATTATSTDAPTATSTDAPTATSTDAPTATSTDAPTATSTDAPTATSTDAPTATSTDAPTATSTDAPTATSTDAPTATSTDAPTATSTDAPTATSTDTPTATSTDAPTATSTDAPTATSTDAPTATSTDATTVTSTDATTATSTDATTAGAVLMLLLLHNTRTEGTTTEATATSTDAPNATFTDAPTAASTDAPTTVITPSPTTEAPVCSDVPTTPRNGNVSADGVHNSKPFPVGTTVTYTCSDGYQLNGDATNVCTGSNTWNGSAPDCDPVCSDVPTTPRNGNVSADGVHNSKPFPVGTTVTYTCSDGYQLNGDATNVCTGSNTWNGSAPDCDPVCSDVPTTPRNGNVSPDGVHNSKPFPDGTTVTYTCSDGYQLNGDATITCTGSNTWNGSAPDCDPVCSDVPTTPRNGNVSPDGVHNSKPFPVGTTVTYTCSDGYQLNGDATNVCTGSNTWNGSAPDCDPDCGQTNITHGEVHYINATTYGSVLRYACFPGYSLSPDVIRACEANGFWNGTSPTCTIKVHGINEECLLDGPEGQCKIQQSVCKKEENSDNYTCQCDRKHFYNISSNTCNKRPELGVEGIEVVTPSKDRTSILYLQWKKNESVSQNNNLIVYNSNDTDTKNSTVDNILKFCIVEELNSGTLYYFRLFSIKDGITSAKSLNGSAYTYPKPPTDGSFANILETSLTFYWTVDMKRNCENYSVEIYPESPETDKQTVHVERLNGVKNQNYTFGGLMVGTNYIIDVFSLVDSNSISSSEHLTRSSYTRPEAISSYQEVEKHATNISFSFVGPNTFYEGYLVVDQTTNKTYNFTNFTNAEGIPDNVTVTVTGLEPGTNYTFEVFTYIGQLRNENGTIIETITSPESPTLVSYESTEYSIYLRWTIAENASFDSFLIEWDTDVLNTSLLSNETRNYTIRDLEHGTCYNIAIKTVLYTLHSDELQIHTCTRPLPPQDVTVTSQTDSNITLQVTPSNQTRFDIIVEYETTNQTFDKTADVVLIGLSQGTEYSFAIYYMIGSVVSLPSFSVNGSTRPGSPTNATIPLDTLRETELTVNWREVEEGEVDEYHIELSSGESTTNETTVSASNTSVRFTGLEPGTEYTATISTIWRNLTSTTNRVLSIYTRPPKPTASITDVTTNTMNVSIHDTQWTYYYFVVSPPPTEGNDTYNVSKDCLPLELTSLEKGKQYNISVYSIIGGIQGENSDQVLSYTKPDKVDSSTIHQDVSTTNSTQMNVTWELPEQGDVGTYELSFTCHSPNSGGEPLLNTDYPNATTSRFAVVSGLDPGTLCTITITTHIGNQTGESVTKDIDISTDETAPGMVANSIVETYARNLTLSWNKPSVPNGIIRRYDVYIIDVKYRCVKYHVEYHCDDCTNTSKTSCDEDNNGMSWTIMECNDNVTNDSKTYVTGDTAYNYTTMVDNKLHPYRNYSVIIRPYTRCYGEENNTTIATKQAAPTGPPLKLQQAKQETTHDTLPITWAPPEEEEQNGVITAYTVYYTFKNRTCFGDDTEGSEMSDSFKVYSKDLDTGRVINSTWPFWVYTVSVSAWTVEGEGPQSDQEWMRTNQTTPDKVRESPEVVDNTSSTLNLTWSHPCHVNGIIDYYKIVVFDVNSSSVIQNATTTLNDTNKQIADLLPYHNYTMSVAAVNTIDQEGFPLNTSKSYRTDTAAPYSPTNVEPTALTANSVSVKWTLPSLYTGVTRYNVIATDARDQTKYFNKETGWDFYGNNTELGDLDEFWNYTVTVTAITSKGQNMSEQSHQVQTKESTPGDVTKVSVSTEQNSTLPRSINVSWNKPVERDLNGILKYFYVGIICSSQDYSKTETRPVNVNGDMVLIINDIKPSPCSISVYAATSVGNGSIVQHNITVPPGAPKRPPETASSPLMKVSEATTVDDKTTQIAVGIPTEFLCDDTNGIAIQRGLIVAAADKATDEPCLGDRKCFDDKMKNLYKNWFQVHTQENPVPYITTVMDWNPCGTSGGGRRRLLEQSEPSYSIGEQGECSGVPTNATCNGQLNPDTSYKVRAFACTEGGCSESAYSAPIKTKPDLVILIVASVTSAVVVVVVVAVGVVIFMKRRQSGCFAKSAEEGSTHSRTNPATSTEMADRAETNKGFVPEPIQLSEFPDTVEKMKKDSGLVFSDAYRMIKDNSPKHTTTFAEGQTCRPKNRYTNILPYDHSRVKLLPLDDDEGSDYINASYIPGYTSKREYIATQGPMPATFDDFWRMVWEQNVEIVVMLTKLVEKGRNKCDKYWPNQNEPQFYGDLSISVMSESNLSDYTLRIMEVKCRNEKRTVKQFSYLKWPDMGCPEYPELLLNFVGNVRQHGPAGTRADKPMVVHCSAGVGRTGTFIAVDHLLQHIRDHDEVDIYSLVLGMRNNRCNMVQTEDQFVYIHDCIREFITNDESEYDEDEDDHIYTNTQQENIYENTGFSGRL